MGYELHITRADLWADNSNKQIRLDEWLDVLSKDPELKLAGINGPQFAIFASAIDPLNSSWLDWVDGNIDSKYPTSRMGKKNDLPC